MAKSKGSAMRKLARLVEKQTTTRVEADYATEGRGTQWYLEWGNGPTVEVMRKHARAAVRSVPELDVAEVGYRRAYDDRHLVAAWLHRAGNEERLGGRWTAETSFRDTGFPDDITDDDPLWDVVDYAFATCGGPSAYADHVIEHVARIGARGLRVEHWLNQQAHLDPSSDSPPASPVLDVSMLSENTRRELDAVVSAILRDLAGHGPRRDDPRVRVLVAEAARTMVTRPVDDHQRQQALLAVAGGTPLYRLSEMVGKSPSTLRKRWDTAAFNRDLAPLAWLRDHAHEWAQACADAVAELRTRTEISEAREVWPLLSHLERAAQDAAAGWRRLLDTPDTARRLLTAVPQARARTRRDLVPRSADAPVRDEATESDTTPALRRLAALLAQYDAAPVPQRRGGAHPGRTAARSAR